MVAGAAPVGEAAADLFYAQGIRAVSAEKVISQVGITKVTFYQHFPSKEKLVVAYLEAESCRVCRHIHEFNSNTPLDEFNLSVNPES